MKVEGKERKMLRNKQIKKQDMHMWKKQQCRL